MKILLVSSLHFRFENAGCFACLKFPSIKEYAWSWRCFYHARMGWKSIYFAVENKCCL